jgi:hypothetical protein
MQISPQRLESIEDECESAGVLEIYFEMVGRGESPVMAQMLAMRQCPALKGTDSEFNRRQNDKMSSMSDDFKRKIRHIAETAGISTAGKTYEGQLGKYNDPDAWVSGTSDVVAVAKKKGLSVTGAVNVQCPQRDPEPSRKPRIAPDILNRLEKKAIADNPVIKERVKKSPSARNELRASLVEKHARKPR